jgi:MarR family transcriptional regulator, organic hydroperoxide resistance regulator
MGPPAITMGFCQPVGRFRNLWHRWFAEKIHAMVCMHNKIYYLRAPMRKEETVDHNIKSAWHAIARMYNQQASKYHVTTSIGFVLLNIHSEEGTPATKIAPLMGLEARSLTRMLKTMEEKKLIYRMPDQIDKRSVRIYLTEVGKQKKELSRASVLLFNNRVRELIPESKLRVFFEVINEINQLATNEKFDPSMFKVSKKS